MTTALDTLAATPFATPKDAAKAAALHAHDLLGTGRWTVVLRHHGLGFWNVVLCTGTRPGADTSCLDCGTAHGAVCPRMRVTACAA